MNKHSLKEKVVLVGGGAKNLGGLISRTFATDGARICVHYNSASTKKDAERPLLTSRRRAARRSPFKATLEKPAMSSRRLRRQSNNLVESTSRLTQRARCCGSRSLRRAKKSSTRC